MSLAQTPQRRMLGRVAFNLSLLSLGLGLTSFCRAAWRRETRWEWWCVGGENPGDEVGEISAEEVGE